MHMSENKNSLSQILISSSFIISAKNVIELNKINFLYNINWELVSPFENILNC